MLVVPICIPIYYTQVEKSKLNLKEKVPFHMLALKAGYKEFEMGPLIIDPTLY